MKKSLCAHRRSVRVFVMPSFIDRTADSVNKLPMATAAMSIITVTAVTSYIRKSV